MGDSSSNLRGGRTKFEGMHACRASEDAGGRDKAVEAQWSQESDGRREDGSLRAVARWAAAVVSRTARASFSCSVPDCGQCPIGRRAPAPPPPASLPRCSARERWLASAARRPCAPSSAPSVTPRALQWPRAKLRSAPTPRQAAARNATFGVAQDSARRAPGAARSGQDAEGDG